MSDFDREAEREKLREKYEEDKEKRQASERMSELLLQGATMTNRHCKECHSPVFRYEGDEFCPTCQQVVNEDGEFVGPAAGENQSEADQPAAANGQQPSQEAGEAADTAPAEAADPDQTTAEPQNEAPATDEPAENRPAPAPDRRPARVDPPARREEDRRDTTDRSESASGNLGEAEAALAREVTALTQQAEETRDIGRKRDLFAAAREAAETLQTIRRL